MTTEFRESDLPLSNGPEHLDLTISTPSGTFPSKHFAPNTTYLGKTRPMDPDEGSLIYSLSTGLTKTWPEYLQEVEAANTAGLIPADTSWSTEIPTWDDDPAHNEAQEDRDYDAELEALLSPNEEARTLSVNILLNGILNNIQPLLTSPEEKTALIRYGVMTAWLLYGRTGEPLPNGFVIKQNKDGTKELSLDYKLPYINRSIAALDEFVHSAFLDRLVEARRNEVMFARPKIEALIEEYVTASPAYKLISSFMEEPAKKTATEAPLSPYWRMVREAGIEREIRNNYGLNTINDDGSVPSIAGDPNATKALQRRLYDLDNARMPDATALQADPFTRAHDYFEALMLQELYKQVGRDDIISVDTDYLMDRITVRILGTGEEPEITYNWPLTFIVGSMIDNLMDKLDASDSLIREAQHRFLGYTIYGILRSERLGLPNDLAYHLDRGMASVEQSSTDFQFSLTRTVGGMIDSSTAAKQILKLRKPKSGKVVGPGIQYDTFGRLNEEWGNVLRESSSLVSKGAYEEMLRKSIGTVEKQDKANGAPMRLLTFGRFDPTIPKSAQHEDIVITLEQHDQTPAILGYTIVSAAPKTGRYGFVHNSEADPYRDCPVIIDQVRRQNLAAQYEYLGLSSLAHAVAKAPNLTVSGLSNLIAKHATYFLPDTEKDTKGNKTRTLHINRAINGLHDFNSSHYIKEGKLTVQCTGAAQFLRCSLEQVFGGKKARSIGGNVIVRGSKNITQAGHEQLVFTHDGQTYVLDATPSGEVSMRRHFGKGSIFGGLALRDMFTRIPKQIEPTATEEKPDEIKTDKPADYESQPISYEIPADRRLENAQFKIIETVKIALGARTENELFKTIATLPNHNPLRRAVELVVRTQAGEADDAYVDDSVYSLETWAIVSQDERKKHNVDQYKPDLLTTLHGLGKTIQSLR